MAAASLLMRRTPASKTPEEKSSRRASQEPAEDILGRIDSWSNLRWSRAANLINSIPFHSIYSPFEASLTVKAIPYSAHGRRFESQLAGDFHLERGVRLSGTPPAVETVGGIYTPRVGQLQRGCPRLLVGDLFNSTLLYFKSRFLNLLILGTI
jgi:hypothetical protein